MKDSSKGIIFISVPKIRNRIGEWQTLIQPIQIHANDYKGLSVEEIEEIITAKLKNETIEEIMKEFIERREKERVTTTN